MIDSFRGENRFLSNFFLNPITVDGIRYWSNEHAFVAFKTLDHATRLRIAKIDRPGDVKRFGRSLELRSDWEHIKIGVMSMLIGFKFPHGSEIAGRLLATDPHSLIEGNIWHDQVWGDCRCGGSRCVGPGNNWLGYLLMVRRIELGNAVESLSNDQSIAVPESETGQ